MFLRSSLFLLFLLLLGMTACRKREVSTDISPARKAHRLFHYHVDLFPLAMRIYYSPSGPDPQSSDPLCGDLELIQGDTAAFPSQNALSYRYHPADTCTDVSVASRKGPLKLTFNGEWGKEGSLVRIKGQGHRSLGLTLEGELKIERKEDEWGYRWKGTSLGTDSDPVSLTGTMSMEQVLGEASPADPKDDRYRFTPDFKGKGLEGASYAIKAASDGIERDMDCRWAWEGTLSVKPRDLGKRKIRYGEGEACSDSVQVFVNGKALRTVLDEAP